MAALFLTRCPLYCLAQFSFGMPEPLMPLAFLFPLSCIAIWAGNGVVSKMAVGVLSPAAFAWSRWVVAALVLTPFLARRVWRERARLRAGIWQIAALALLGMVLNQTFGYYAAQTMGATEMGLMMGLTPLLTVLFSIWLLRERPTWGAILGALLSIMGLAILLGQGDPTRLFTHGIQIGSVYMLLSAGTYALYSVLLKKWDLGLDNWSLLYSQVLCSVVLLTPSICWWMVNCPRRARSGSSSMRGSPHRRSAPGSGCRGSP